MPILRNITLTVALLWGWSNCFAADSGLGLVLVNYSLSDADGQKAEPGYVITINAQLVNYDTNQYVGLIDFGLRNNTTILTSINGIFSRPSFSGLPIVLGAQEIVPVIFSVTINPQYFKPGPDVVVVWPITKVPFRDSIEIPFTVVDNGTLGFEDQTGISDEKQLGFTYSLTENKILLLNLASETNFKQVRIFNLDGQKVSDLKSDHIREVPIPNLPKGIYLSEFITADGKRRVIKFWH